MQLLKVRKIRAKYRLDAIIKYCTFKLKHVAHYFCSVFLNMIVIILGPNYEPKDEEVCLMENGI